MPDITEQAKTAIGTEAPRDWELRPRQAIAALPENAAPLKRILARSDIDEIIDTYHIADAAAGRAQKVYKRLAKWSAASSFLAIVIASGLLLAHSFLVGATANLSLLSGIQGFLLVLSFLLSITLAHWRPFDRWMRERAKAEHERASLFNRIMRAEETAQPNELPVLPLKLEYFRRYQLDVQRKYYRERGGEHARAVSRATALRWLGTIVVGLAALPLAAGMLGTDWSAWAGKLGLPHWASNIDFQQRLFISLSTVGAALQGLLAATLLLNQDERNASRYAATAENLEALASRPLEEARAAAAQGDRDAVEAFFSLVQEQISSEHREWVSLRSVVPSLSLARLKQANLPWAR